MHLDQGRAGGPISCPDPPLELADLGVHAIQLVQPATDQLGAHPPGQPAAAEPARRLAGTATQTAAAGRRVAGRPGQHAPGWRSGSAPRAAARGRRPASAGLRRGPGHRPGGGPARGLSPGRWPAHRSDRPCPAGAATGVPAPSATASPQPPPARLHQLDGYGPTIAAGAFDADPDHPGLGLQPGDQPTMTLGVLRKLWVCW